MDEPALRQLLDDVRSGVLHPDDAVIRLRRLPFADLGFARIDHHRELRQRTGEAVYAPGKSPDQCTRIVTELLEQPGGPVIVTRAADRQLPALPRTRPAPRPRGARRVGGAAGRGARAALSCRRGLRRRGRASPGRR